MTSTSDQVAATPIDYPRADQARPTNQPNTFSGLITTWDTPHQPVPPLHTAAVQRPAAPPPAPAAISAAPAPPTVTTPPPSTPAPLASRTTATPASLAPNTTNNTRATQSSAAETEARQATEATPLSLAELAPPATEVATQPPPSPSPRRQGWWQRTVQALTTPAAPPPAQTRPPSSAPTGQPRLGPPPGQPSEYLLGQINQRLARTPYMIATTSLKGGVGKTTVSACLGLALARHRADRVIAIDANMDAGTLAERLLGRAVGDDLITVQHLLDDLTDTPPTTISALDDYTYTAERLSFLAGHHDPSAGAAFAEDDYAELIGLLSHFWHVILADCGTGLAGAAMRTVLDHTDTLVLATTPTPDSAGLAEETLNWLAANGYRRLADSAVAVLCHNGHHPSPHAQQLRAHLEQRCRRVISLPPDPHLAQGHIVRLDHLSPEARHSILELAAAVIDAAPTSRPHPE